MDNRAINLLDQIIKKAEEEDVEHKKRAIASHKASQSLGDSWMVFHLKALRTLVTSEE